MLQSMVLNLREGDSQILFENNALKVSNQLCLIGNNVIDDVGAGCSDFRYISPIIVWIVFCIGYCTFISSHHIHSVHLTDKMRVNVQSDLVKVCFV
jgi:hypothetical protein